MSYLIGICDDEIIWREQAAGCVQEYLTGAQVEVDYRTYASAEEYLQSGEQRCVV